MRNGAVEETCFVSGMMYSLGGEEDNQIFVNVQTAQRLADLPGRISVLEATVPGTPQSINNYIVAPATTCPKPKFAPSGNSRRARRRFTTGSAALLTATVGIVLVLTGLCVMAAMTNVAMERRMDVGLMKAIGGAMRRVLRLFLAEAALLGLAGGVAWRRRRGFCCPSVWAKRCLGLRRGRG